MKGRVKLHLFFLDQILLGIQGHIIHKIKRSWLGLGWPVIGISCMIGCKGSSQVFVLYAKRKILYGQMFIAQLDQFDIFASRACTWVKKMVLLFVDVWSLLLMSRLMSGLCHWCLFSLVDVCSLLLSKTPFLPRLPYMRWCPIALLLSLCQVHIEQEKL